jgi:hypothetical protein
MCVGSKGTTLAVTLGGVLTTIGRVESIQCPQSTLTTFRCKDLDDTYEGLHVEGTIEGGQASATVFYDPTDAGHAALLENVHSTDFVDLTPAERKGSCEVEFTQLTSPLTWAFVGVTTQFNISANVGEPLKGDLSIEVERTTSLPA